MTLSQAERYAGAIQEWLAPHCVRMEIAGSIRRKRPVCADVDLVVIAKRHPDVDLLGMTVGEANLLFDFLVDYVKDGSRGLFREATPPGRIRAQIVP